MSDPLFTLGARRTSEILVEAVVPMFACIGAWRLAKRVLAEPSIGRGLTGFETVLLLAAFVCVFSWYGGRQLVLFNQRSPWRIVMVSAVFALTAVGLLGSSVQTGFDARCEAAGGFAQTPMELAGIATRVCKLGGVPGNPYLPGTLLRAPWDGSISPPLWVLLGGLSVITTIGTRHRRLRPTRMGVEVAQLLRLAPAAGSGAVAGGDALSGVQACGNPTLWGELCGQAYPAAKEFEPGEWCIRCSQVYSRCERELTFRVVGLVTTDVDVLNGLERLDALAWDPGDPMPPDARLSGQERWAILGEITVPDVLTVTQVLAFVHENLKGWSGDDDDVNAALDLASQRASKLSAWIWMGAVADRLTYARPTDRTALALGSSRLRDLLLDAGEPLTLQLDLGLLPLELRTAFRKTFLDPDRKPVLQNTKQDLWVPVAPNTSSLGGQWVPRIEGKALRRWLSLDRLRPAEQRGVTTPLPYVLPGAEVPVLVLPGSLDLVRTPLDTRTNEPLLAPRPGDSLAEWEWMEWRQIDLLRQQTLVMVDR